MGNARVAGWWTAWPLGEKDDPHEKASPGGRGGGWGMRGWRVGGQLGLWARKTIQMREHRTEVTEATEGDGGCAGGGLVDSLASGRERRSR